MASCSLKHTCQAGKVFLTLSSKETAVEKHHNLGCSAHPITPSTQWAKSMKKCSWARPSDTKGSCGCAALIHHNGILGGGVTSTGVSSLFCFSSKDLWVLLECHITDKSKYSPGTAQHVFLVTRVTKHNTVVVVFLSRMSLILLQLWCEFNTTLKILWQAALGSKGGPQLPSISHYSKRQTFMSRNNNNNRSYFQASTTADNINNLRNAKR